MGALEHKVQSSFEEFRQKLDKAKQVDIELTILLPIVELPVETGIQGPLTESMIEEYAQKHEVPLQKAQEYNSVMGKKWSSVSQLVDQGEQKTPEIAEELGIQPNELTQFYQIANWVFKNKTQNPSQGKPVYRHEPTLLDQPTKVLVKYTATKPFWKKQEHQEQLKYLGRDEFTNIPNQNEINYIMHELNKRVNQLQKVTITIPGIQEKTQYEPEQLKQKIADYIRKKA